MYSSSSGSTCFLGIDVGSELELSLTRIRFFPNSKWIIAANYLIGATIQASNDGVQYDTIASIDSTVHSGWNIVPFSLNQNYRYVRFVHDSTSKCELAELEVQGILHSKKTVNSLTSNFVDIVYEDGANRFTYANAI